jgi:cysteinyl-tRNA synthetase
MDDDFNTPARWPCCSNWRPTSTAGGGRDQALLLRALGGTLGVLQQPPRAYLQAGAGLDDAAIQALIEQRAAAKAARNFAEADRIRRPTTGTTPASTWRGATGS